MLACLQKAIRDGGTELRDGHQDQRRGILGVERLEK